MRKTVKYLSIVALSFLLIFSGVVPVSDDSHSTEIEKFYVASLKN